jgi:hypothetical protein
MTTGSVAGVTLKTDLSLENMTAQVAAQPAVYAGKLFQQPAGRAKGIREDLQKPKPDLLAELKAQEVQLAQRAKQAADVSSLDITYNKQEAVLSVKVKNELSGNLVRELHYKDYKAMAYTSHGYKGSYVDLAA